jgi:Resolvase, N terminal domain
MVEKKSRRKATVARIHRVRRPAPKKPRQPPSPSEERVLHPNGVLIGYARVSTLDQNLTLQRDALTAAGCTKLFVEQISGMVLERPALRDALEFAPAGDTIVAWKLDRLARSMNQLIETLEALLVRNIGFRSLKTPILRLRRSRSASGCHPQRSIVICPPRERRLVGNPPECVHEFTP